MTLVLIFALMFAVSFAAVTAFQLAIGVFTLTLGALLVLGRLVVRQAAPSTRLPR